MMSSTRKKKLDQQHGYKSEETTEEIQRCLKDHSTKEDCGLGNKCSNGLTTMLVLAAVIICASIMVGNQAVKIATFNTALTSSLQHYSYRAEKARNTLWKIKADFVCLQEVWYIEDVLAIMESAKEVFPHTYSYHHSSIDRINSTATTTIACHEPEKVARVYQCAKLNCDIHNRSMILPCVNKYCSNSVADLDQNCLSCLVMAGKDHYKMCLSMAFNLPGLLILSKLPLVNPIQKRYFPDTLLYLPRVYLQVDVPDIGRIVCTHLTASISEAHYFERLNFTSEEKQQEDETKHLLKDLNSIRAGERKSVIVAGDFNMGPMVRSKGVDPDFANNYDLFLKNGFHDTYIRNGGDCTWCANNPLTIDTKNCIYDHVLVKGAAFGTNAQKIMTEKLAGVDFPLSDHYGVIVDIEIKSYWRMLSEYVLTWIYSVYNSVTTV